MQQSLSKFSKNDIRRSLRASTLDGVFAAIFSNATGGILLTKFLVDLEVNTLQIGLLSAIPMMVNLVQPLGAFLADQTISRYRYCRLVYGTSRILWLILGLAIFMISPSDPFSHQTLLDLTLAIVVITSLLGALGGSAWMSWMATLVPKKLRGRYFGLRNSASSLSNLIAIPVMGMMISYYPLGPIRGYGMIVLLGVIMGLMSLACQQFMVDVNPQLQHPIETLSSPILSSQTEQISERSGFLLKFGLWSKVTTLIRQNPNFFIFLIYYDLWMFAVNLSLPFFSIYLLQGLKLDVSLVTVYASLQAGIYMLVLPYWGRLADRIGNRPLLLLIGIIVSTIPLLWTKTHHNSFSIWILLPLLYLFMGGTWAALDLCNQNLQMGLAPIRNQSSYFALTSASTGISSALGTTTGGILAQFVCKNPENLLILFALSSVLMLTALIPLTFAQEPGGKSPKELLQKWGIVIGINRNLTLKNKPAA
ncbi:Major facilitator superfamily MFS_1 [Planktothrix serta PCC 8927]|uniref:Major facilitator superfamily MFS_1 n=1 Tax=Planktothrix serta PCC 8927 TaxID=671068 RepID=A0A7Z9BU51_9CYAN|nr:MFS transporter [Planktothrix serta]VXD22335.1 Major facilitator superfamily MFS_1 [Planktothrix serta PCC 8927]